MIILGVDTSLRSTGFGVLEVIGNRMHALEYGNIPNNPKMRLSECLKHIHEKITDLIVRHNPDIMSIERVIYGKNANTMLVLGEARGVVIVASGEIPIYDYEPRRVKMAVCGNGMAEKEQVQRMVKTLLKLDEIPQDDAADALALAICHANSKSLLTLVDTRI